MVLIALAIMIMITITTITTKVIGVPNESSPRQMRMLIGPKREEFSEAKKR